MVRDECPLDPRTKQRVGPSTLSTIVFVLISLSAITWAANTTREVVANEQERTGRRILAGVGVLAYCVALSAYFLDRPPVLAPVPASYYRQCQPWTGWFLFTASGIVRGPRPAGDRG